MYIFDTLGLDRVKKKKAIKVSLHQKFSPVHSTNPSPVYPVWHSHSYELCVSVQLELSTQGVDNSVHSSTSIIEQDKYKMDPQVATFLDAI